MHDEKRNRFECIDILRRAAFESFNARRSYEWKFSLSIWTAEAVLIAGLLQPSKPDAPFPLTGGVVIGGAVVMAYLLVRLHIYFSEGIARANGIDKSVSQHFAKAMRDMLELPFDPLLEARIAVLPESNKWWSWAHLVEISMTALLAAVAVLIIAIRA